MQNIVSNFGGQSVITQYRGVSKMKHFLISITQYVIKIEFCLADGDNLFTLIALYQIGRVRIFVRL